MEIISASEVFPYDWDEEIKEWCEDLYQLEKAGNKLIEEKEE